MVRKRATKLFCFYEKFSIYQTKHKNSEFLGITLKLVSMNNRFVSLSYILHKTEKPIKVTNEIDII